MPRSYVKDIPPGQTKAFVLTANPGKEFDRDYRELLSKRGKDLVENNLTKFNVSYHNI